jgi:hypothetical protein
MLRIYALAPETVRRIMRGTYWRFMALATASMLVFGLYLGFLAGPVRWSVAGPIFGLVALAYFFVIFFQYRAQLRLLYSVRYEIDGAGVAYRELGKDAQRILRAEIASVRELKNGLLVEQAEEGPKLLIPRGLAREGDADFRETLGAWTGIIPKEARPKPPLGPQLAIALGGSLLVLLFANSLIVILPLLVAVLITGFGLERRIESSGDHGPGLARMYSFAFSFLIFVMMMKTCLIAVTALAGN